MFTLTVITALGCGLNAGIFYAFSSFVMKAMGNLPSAQGADAMRRINIDVINPWFMIVFMGTPLLCVVLLVMSAINPGDVGAPWRIAAALLHLLGCFGVTMVFNVPLNNRLANTEPGTPEAEALWAHYLKAWTAWNTVRTIAPAAALLALLLSLRG